jgi:phenylpropionate dioxygenase-like ring-hydroxylating dioxygenase large terminal subunit
MPAWPAQEPRWAEADPGIIGAALDRALRRPSGHWYVYGSSRELRDRHPVGRIVAGQELVAWRGTDGRAHVGPGACPHLGAPLCRSPVVDGRLVCHWHGLALGPGGRPGWRTFPTHDDGVLLWVRLDQTGDEAGGEPPLPVPVVPQRPPVAESLVEVATVVGRCEPSDVLANRLDPWHGSWLHPYAFANLRVLSTPTPEQDRFVVEVAYRVAGRVGVPVTAEFSCPGPRTVLMRIVDGDGAGSVVETHATPLGAGADGVPRTAVIEATVAHSGRRGFALARAASPLLRPLIRRAATRLWRDDIDYAERRYDLRTRK